MARFDKSSSKSPKQDAAVAQRARRAKAPPSYEDTMFFTRLRRHAKWMFVFLALVFGLGFVLFGVGAGGTGIGDLFRGGGTSSGVSVSDARKRTEESPKNALAWRDLSTALQTEGQTTEAISALEEYVALKPRDPDALRELAGLYFTRAAEAQRDAQAAQLEAALAGASQNFPGLTAGGQTVIDDPIGKAINARAFERVSAAQAQAQDAARSAISVYVKLAELQPRDPNVQLELAQAAQQAGDAQTAIGAYEQFLQLAPDDPNATIVKEQLKQLRQAAASG
jgi:tetratricopeptide (TPR) repeat protein